MLYTFFRWVRICITVLCHVNQSNFKYTLRIEVGKIYTSNFLANQIPLTVLISTVIVQRFARIFFYNKRNQD